MTKTRIGISEKKIISLLEAGWKTFIQKNMNVLKNFVCLPALWLLCCTILVKVALCQKGGVKIGKCAWLSITELLWKGFLVHEEKRWWVKRMMSKVLQMHCLKIYIGWLSLESLFVYKHLMTHCDASFEFYSSNKNIDCVTMQ